MPEEPYIESCRRRVEEQYAHTELASGGIGGCFGSILCSELHYGPDGNGLHFNALAAKWGIPVSILGELIWDHCKRLESPLTVKHEPDSHSESSPLSPHIQSRVSEILKERGFPQYQD